MSRDSVVVYLLNLVYLVTLAVQLPRCVWRYVVYGKYRGTLGVRLWGQVEQRHGPARCVWFEAASLGEVRALEPLVRAFQHRYPQWQCVISASTTSGLALARQLFPDIYVFPLPVDFSWAMESTVARIRPDLLVIVDIEPWQNLLRAAKRRGARVVVVNGRMTDRDFRLHLRMKWHMTRAIRQIDLVTAQSLEYADRFVQLGAVPERVQVVGSLKFDGVETNRDNEATRRLARLARIGQKDIVFMAGSTHAGEEKLALSVYRRLADRYPELRLVIAPRHTERSPAIARVLERSGLRWQRSSRLEQEGRDPDARVLLIDTLGEVAWWWGVSQVAFVGGSLFGGRGRNMLEPAAYRAAVCFGPEMSDFRCVVQDLLLHRAAAVVRDERELVAFVERCLRDTEFRETLGERAQRLVQSRCGVTQDTLRYLAPMVTCQEQIPGAVPPQPARWELTGVKQTSA